MLTSQPGCKDLKGSSQGPDDSPGIQSGPQFWILSSTHCPWSWITVLTLAMDPVLYISPRLGPDPSPESGPIPGPALFSGTWSGPPSGPHVNCIESLRSKNRFFVELLNLKGQSSISVRQRVLHKPQDC